MPWYDMPWFVFRLTNRWGWKWLNPTQPAVVALWIIFCSFHSKIQIILSQSYWIMITFDGAMLRCSELPPDVRFLFPGFRDSFSLQGIFCVSLNTVAFPVWWSHGVAFLATYLLLDQRHGIFMLLRTSGLITGARKKCFFIHFIFNVNPLILESFDTWLKMCTVALSFSPSHCFAVNLYRCCRCCFVPALDRIWNRTQLRWEHIWDMLIHMQSWWLWAGTWAAKAKKNNPQVDVWIFSNDRIFRI